MDWDFLSTFYLQKYRFSCTVSEEMLLFQQKGSSLRGLFGSTLKMVSCRNRGEPCYDCQWQDLCSFRCIFEPAPLLDDPHAGKYNDYPRPYVLIPPLDGKRIYRRGDEFVFGLVLIGSANEHLHTVVRTVEQMGARGFEKGGGAFIIREIAFDNGPGKQEAFYSGGIPTRTPCVLAWEDFETLSLAGDIIHIFLETPLRRKIRNHLAVTAPSFSEFAKLLFERASLLNFRYCDGPYPESFDNYLNETCNVCMVPPLQLQWIDFERYSRRQKAKMQLGGITGTISYKGDVSSFIPLLHLGEYINIGKSTTFGLGKFKLVKDRGSRRNHA